MAAVHFSLRQVTAFVPNVRADRESPAAGQGLIELTSTVWPTASTLHRQFAAHLPSAHLAGLPPIDPELLPAKLHC